MTTYSIAQIEATTETKVISLLSGGNSRVYYCRHSLPSSSNGSICRAIKIYDRENSKKRVERILSEKLILQRLTFLNNPYISKLIDTTKDNKYLYFVLEAYHCGHLNLHITDSEYGRFTPAITRNYAAEIVSALLFLTRCGCVHRDIKPKNCLVDRTGHMKLCDFGASKILFSEDEYKKVINQIPTASPKTYTLTGTLQYMAPEIIARTCGYSLQVDWWSFGLFMFEMLCGRLPNSKQSNNLCSSEDSLSIALNAITLSNSTCLRQQAIINDLIQTDHNSLYDHSMKEDNCDPWDLTVDTSLTDLLTSSQLSLHAWDLIKKFLIPSPDHRWGPWKQEKIKNHPFFSTIDWGKVESGHSLPPDIDFNKNLGFLDLTIGEDEGSNSNTENENNFFKDFG
jgi:serine/threonine protein kinase